MSTTTIARPTTTSTGCSPDDVVHYYCCDKNTAWCGEDITNSHACPDNCPCQPCVVCDDLDRILTCHICGTSGADIYE